MTASQLLRASRLASGISQGELAARAHTSQPEVSSIERGRRVPTVDTLERLLRQTGHRLVSVPGVGADSSETGDRIASALQSGSADSALRAFLDYSDNLARHSGTSRFALAIAEPRPTGSAAWDAALAALVDYWFAKSRLPKPEWTQEASRVLSHAQSPQLSSYDVAPNLDDVPPEFLRRNVLIERSTLASI